MKNKKLTVTILPEKKSFSLLEGATMLYVLEKAGIHIDTPCRGKGICGKCKILIKKGIPEPSITEQDLLTKEEILQGYRLACQARPVADSVIEIPQQSRLDFKKAYSSHLKGDVHRLPHDFPFESDFEKICLTLKKPSLDDQRSDWERITAGISSHRKEKTVRVKTNVDLLKEIPRLLRNADDKITITLCENDLIDIEKGNTVNHGFGMAFDIGTTTVAGYLLDLKSGEELSVVAKTNPQIIYGDDIIARIGFAQENEDGFKKLQSVIINVLNEIIMETSERAQIDKENIYKVTISGNTCMHHMLLGLPTSYIASSPYIPVIKEGINLKAKDLPGIKLSPNTHLYFIPNISAFVGADISSGILASGMWKNEKTTLFVDLGTNGEIVLGNKNKLWACSTAAGPAFEGARISSGIRAAEGAIDRVKIDGKQLTYHVIKDGKIRGICGSGLIDLVAEMLNSGLIDKTGRLISRELCYSRISEELANRIMKDEKNHRFLVANGKATQNGHPISITQKDIREIQLAKAAIFAGIKILLKEADLLPDEIGEILLAGAFGNFINKESARRLGLIPPVALNKIESVGNAAGRGTEMVLLSDEMKRKCGKISQEVAYIELSSRKDFQKEFMDAMFF